MDKQVTLPGEGAMLKALFVMIVLSNEFAARMVARVSRHPAT